MKTKEKNIFTSILINTRSVLPKLQSLHDTLNELAADVCVVTEKWLKEQDCDNQQLIDFQEKQAINLSAETGLLVEAVVSVFCSTLPALRW